MFDRLMKHFLTPRNHVRGLSNFGSDTGQAEWQPESTKGPPYSHGA